SLIFYCHLNFKILYKREPEKFVFLEREGSQLMLEELNDDSWKTGVLEIPFGRGINFQIRVNDVDQLYKVSTQNGFQIYKTIYEKWYRVDDRLYGHRQFLIQDPDGYLLRFFQELGMKES
ncbi:MAG: hypothetical protein A3E88_03560, partial [Legionellales bacterium RIFCSPHIGHO2_12_FULL_35_11]